MHKVQRRTNNNIEGWHLRLNRRVANGDSNIYKFTQFKNSETEILSAQIADGNIIIK